MKMNEGKMMKKEGRNMAKADMQKADMKKDKSMIGKALKKHASMPASKAHAGLKKGGLLAGHKAADGVASKGKTKGMQVKMRGGGKC